MADGTQVKKIIQAIHKDPKLLDTLMNADDDNSRKQHLERHGLIKKGEHGPTREQAEKEIRKLVNLPEESGEAERAVEWVAAIGTAAAGAGAAFCAAE